MNPERARAAAILRARAARYRVHAARSITWDEATAHLPKRGRTLGDQWEAVCRVAQSQEACEVFAGVLEELAGEVERDD